MAMIDLNKPVELIGEPKSVCTLLVQEYFLRKKSWMVVLLKTPGRDDIIDYIDPINGEAACHHWYRNVPEPETRVPLEQGDNWVNYHWVRGFDSTMLESITRIGLSQICVGTDWRGYQYMADNYERSADGVNWEPCWKVAK